MDTHTQKQDSWVVRHPYFQLCCINLISYNSRIWTQGPSMLSSALRVYCSTVHCVTDPGSWHLLSISVFPVLQRQPRARGCCRTMIQNCFINLRIGCVWDSESHIPPSIEMVLISPSTVGLSDLISHPRVMRSLFILIWQAVGSLWWTSNTYPRSFSIVLVIMSSLVTLRQIYFLGVLAVSLLFSRWTIFPAPFSKYHLIKYKTCAKKFTLSYIKTNAYSIHPQSCASNTTLYTDLKFLYFLFFLYVCVCGRGMPQHSRAGRRITCSCQSSPIMWVPRFELRSPGLTANTLIH